MSGLLTEAEPARWREDDLIPYATASVECFGIERVMYGSDWPVLTLAGSYADWYGFTERFTASWSAADRNRFYADNAVRAYGL
jgi:L-fuconolactonase